MLDALFIHFNEFIGGWVCGVSQDYLHGLGESVYTGSWYTCNRRNNYHLLGKNKTNTQKTYINNQLQKKIVDRYKVVYI